MITPMSDTTAWDAVLKATEGHKIDRITVDISEGQSWTYITCTCGEESFREDWEFTDHIRRLVFDAIGPFIPKETGR